MDESTKEEAIQEEGFEMTFDSFCLNKPDYEIVVRFQLMISTEFSFNGINDKVLIKGLNREENSCGDGIKMREVKGLIWLTDWYLLLKSVRVKNNEHKYEIWHC